MNVLGIESSCDETAAALVRDDGLIVSDIVASQVKVHAPYGGVVPELASREHLKAIASVTQEALRIAAERGERVDAIAVTNGPGLVGALLVGLSAAKAYAWATGLPLIGVNHLVGHLMAVFLKRGEPPYAPVPNGPFIGLLASGGHTALYEVRGVDDIEQLGQTRDDAAGEAFDKAAKLLGLGYPGGPVVDRLAAQGDPKAVRFPLPMPSTKRLDFSFSGLKTAVAMHVAAHGRPTTEQGMKDVCASFQRVLVEVLVRKSVAACEQRGVRDLVLTGGVAANRGLRARAKEMCDAHGVTLHVPPMASCTDNAAMIAYAGARRFAAGYRDDLNLEAYSRSPDLRRGKILEQKPA